MLRICNPDLFRRKPFCPEEMPIPRFALISIRKYPGLSFPYVSRHRKRLGREWAAVTEYSQQRNW